MASKSRYVEPSYIRRLARLPKEFTYQDLEKATSNFSKKLGRGGSGSVFEGLLKDETRIAVKKVERSDYGATLFENEVSTIASAQHVNLIHLQGFCKHEIENKGESFIVYDLLPNGSLDTWIFPQDDPSNRYLSWKQRYQVAIDVATALVYLHHGCNPQIIHFDVKPPNILLNGDFRAVLADFGLSIVAYKNGSHVHSNMSRGTRGYIAPELNEENQVFSSKCDMYSFGKVLLDLFLGQVYVVYDMTGKDIFRQSGNTSLEEKTCHVYLRKMLKRKEIMKLVDKSLKKVNLIEVNTLVDVALRCVEEDPRRRPVDMRKVLRLLEQGQQEQDENWHELAVIFHGALLDQTDINQSDEEMCAELSVGTEMKRTSFMSDLANLNREGEFTFLLDTSSNMDTLYIKLVNMHDQLHADAEICLLDLIEKKKIKKRYEFQGDYLEGHIRIEMQLRKAPEVTDDSEQAVHVELRPSEKEKKEHDQPRVLIDEFTRESRIEKASSSGQVSKVTSELPFERTPSSPEMFLPNEGTVYKAAVAGEIVFELPQIPEEDELCSSLHHSLVVIDDFDDETLIEKASTLALEVLPWHTLVIIVHGVNHFESRLGEDLYTHLFAVVEFGIEKLRTRQVVKRRDPKWEEVFTFPLDHLPTNQNIFVQVAGRTRNNSKVINSRSIDLVEVLENKLVDQEYQMGGDGCPMIHLELEFRYGSGITPRTWTKGTLVVTIHRARYINREEAGGIFVDIVVYGDRRSTKVVKDAINPEWEEEFVFAIDETTIRRMMVMEVILCGTNSDLTEVLGCIGSVNVIDIKRTIRRKHTNMWYQVLQENSNLSPEINIETKWIPYTRQVKH